MKINFDNPNTRWALTVGTIALLPHAEGPPGPILRGSPLDRILAGVAQHEAVPSGAELMQSTHPERGNLHVVWGRGLGEDTLLAVREDPTEAMLEAEHSYSAPSRIIWTARPWGRPTAVLRAWTELSRRFVESPEFAASIPERIEVDGLSVPLLVRPGRRVLILGVNSEPRHRALEDRARAIIEELDRFLDLAGRAGSAATYQLYSLAVLGAQREGMTPSEYLLDELGEAAAWAVVAAERGGDDLVRAALVLDEPVLPRLRLRLQPGGSETLKRRVEELRKGEER